MGLVGLVVAVHAVADAAVPLHLLQEQTLHVVLLAQSEAILVSKDFLCLQGAVDHLTGLAHILKLILGLLLNLGFLLTGTLLSLHELQ